jgi:hypothetical protein
MNWEALYGSRCSALQARCDVPRGSVTLRYRTAYYALETDQSMQAQILHKTGRIMNRIRGSRQCHI